MELLNTSLVQHFNILRTWPEPALSSWKKRKKPSLEELSEKMIGFFKSMGYEMKKVKPEEATCIIRAFEGNNLYVGDLCYSCYGVICYVKKNGEWVSKMRDGQQDFSIHPEKQIIPMISYKGEMVELETDRFEDLYLAVS